MKSKSSSEKFSDEIYLSHTNIQPHKCLELTCLSNALHATQHTYIKHVMLTLKHGHLLELSALALIAIISYLGSTQLVILNSEASEIVNRSTTDRDTVLILQSIKPQSNALNPSRTNFTMGPKDPPDWWKAQQEITLRLNKTDQSLFQLVVQRTNAIPDTAQICLEDINLFLRAGLFDQANARIDRMQAMCPELNNSLISSIYYAACDHFQAWEIAQHILDVYANQVSELALENRLLKYLTENGWTPQKIDEWLAKKTLGTNGFWIKERVGYRARCGTADILIQEHSEKTRINRDIDQALLLLDSLQHAKPYLKTVPELNWLSSVIKPEQAIQAEQIGSRLKQLGQWKPASEYLRLALNIPLSQEEVRQLASQRQMVISEERLRLEFQVHLQDALAVCLLELGDKTEAQKLMEHSSVLRTQHGLHANRYFEGMVQSQTGSRAIETQILQKEPLNESSPEYWLERAHYFRGRSEAILEEHAYKKVLELAPPKVPEKSPGKGGYQDNRAVAISEYAKFLKRQQKTLEAAALLKQELATAPAMSISAERSARDLAFEFSDILNPNELSYWKWLGNRPRWEYIEERLLWRLLENASENQREQVFRQAEDLCKGADPTRCKTLGWILNRLHHPARSIPLLKDAMMRGSGELARSSAFTLFECYLDTENWKEAEVLFPIASSQLTSQEQPVWFSRIAVIAARSGNLADAMRLWKKVINLDLSCTSGLKELASLGLQVELKQLYREIQKELPDSSYPQKSLKQLMGDR